LTVARHLGRATAPQASGMFGQFAGDPTSFPSWIWDEGATIFVTINCYASDWDLQKKAGSVARPGHDVAVWNLDSTAKEPVCLLQATLVSTESSRTHLAQKAPGATTRHNRVSVRVIGKLGSSFFRAREPNAVLLYITSALVLLQLPMKFVRFVALNCLGRLSRIYKSIVVQDFDVVYHCARAIVLLASQSVCFLELADKPGPDGDDYGGISRQRMLERVLACVRHRTSYIDAGEVTAISDFAFRKMRTTSKIIHEGFIDLEEFNAFGCNPFHRKSDKCDSLDQGVEEILDIDHFCKATGSDSLSLEDVVSLFDRDRRYWPGERLFTPAELWKQVHVGERRRGAARLSRMDELRGSGHVPLEHMRTSFNQALSDGTEARQVVTDLFTKLVQVGKEMASCTTEVELLRLHVDELRTELQHERELRQSTEVKLTADLHKHAAESCKSRDLRNLEEAVREDMLQLDSDLRLDLSQPSTPKSEPRRTRSDADVKMLRQQLSKLDVKLTAVKRTSDDTLRLRAELAEGMDRMMRQAVEAARDAAEEKYKLLLGESAAATADRTESAVDELARNAMDELGASHGQLLETLAAQTYRLEQLDARVEKNEGKPREKQLQRPESPAPMAPAMLHGRRRRELDLFDCSNQRRK